MCCNKLYVITIIQDYSVKMHHAFSVHVLIHLYVTYAYPLICTSRHCNHNPLLFKPISENTLLYIQKNVILVFLYVYTLAIAVSRRMGHLVGAKAKYKVQRILITGAQHNYPLCIVSLAV